MCIRDRAFHLFQDMLARLNTKMTIALMRAAIPMREPEQPSQQPSQPQQHNQPEQPAEQAAPVPAPKKVAPELKQAGNEMPHQYNYSTSKANPNEDAQRRAASAPQGEQHRTQPIKVAPKVGRNDLCPCGSGKKYKNCHGRLS